LWEWELCWCLELPSAPLSFVRETVVVVVVVAVAAVSIIAIVIVISIVVIVLAIFLAPVCVLLVAW